MAEHFRVLNVEAGYVGFVVAMYGLRRVYLPEETAARIRARVRADYPLAGENDDLLPTFAQELTRYFAGEPVIFTVAIDWTGYSSFDADVWRSCLTLGYGEVASYGDLARKVRRPGGARAVGGAMARNPMPIVVPCHRVLRGDGSIGGYSGHCGVSFKKRLLEMESAALT
ncbi:MAG: methylated-DNA--[protein]-cysteine S-methyltransferase [Phycisphaerales bacterium]|nr:methylated-DNA--[protein]-cysteine S-methyltransferase [Phycisphaerales bacterium]